MRTLTPATSRTLTDSFWLFVSNVRWRVNGWWTYHRSLRMADMSDQWISDHRTLSQD